MTETPDDHPTEHLPPQPAPVAPSAQHDVFAAQPRAPRVPWVNPARRSRLGLVAAGAAVVLFGAGFGIGWASSDGGGHNGHRDWMRYPGYLQPYEGGGRQFAPPGHHRKPKQPRPAQSATASPNPTKTS